MRVLFVSDRFPLAMELLRELLPGDEVVREERATATRADVLVPQMERIDGELLDRVRPRLVMQFGVGLESVDRAAAEARGIAVDNIPAAGTGNAEAVGEIAILHLLALTRRLRPAGEAVAATQLGHPVGISLLGKPVAVIGRGAVGSAVAERLAGFGVDLRLLGSRDSTDLPAALAGAAATIVACRLDATTRGMVDAAALAAMAPGSYLVNVARGPVVDYDALLAALRSGRLAGAGLDVFWREPIDPGDPLLAENVSVTPHVGGVTRDSYRGIAERFAAKVEALRASLDPASGGIRERG